MALAALAPTPIGRLSRRLHQLLQHGDVEQRYPSRSEVVQALALAAVNARWPFERLLWALLDRRNIGGEKVQEIAARNGDNEARRYVHKSWTKAWTRARISPAIADRTTARNVIAEIEIKADRFPWSGRAGSTDRAVIQAHIEIATMIGHLDHGASVRQVGKQFLNGGTIPAGTTSDGQLVTFRFPNAGRYLVVCMNRTHFLNDWEFGFVNVGR